MHTKAKSRLSTLFILLSSLVISLISITAVFALTEQNTKTRVDIIYISNVVPLEEMSFTLSDDGTSYSVTACDSSVTGTVVIPEEYEGSPVTIIGNSAFSSRKGLTNIVIPNSVTTIGNSAFYNCEGLIGVTIGSGVTSIGNAAFNYCKNLSRIVVDENNSKYHSDENCLIETSTKTLVRGCKTSVIPTNGSVTSIGSYAFHGCTGLTSVNMPDGVTSIGSYAFHGCTDLTSIEISDSMTSIGSYAFYECGSLTSIEIPNNVTNIGTSAFDRCTTLTSVTIGSGVTRIGSDAFYECGGLTSIEIPDSVVSIGTEAFRYCTGLTSVTIGSGVTSIENFAFNRCTSLTSITVASGNTTYHSDGDCLIETATGKLIQGCMTSVIPDGVVSIGNGAFEYTDLTSIEIPNSVTSIGSEAFQSCFGLKSIIIPDSVKTIDEGAFFGCSALETVVIGSGVKLIGLNAFALCEAITSAEFKITAGWGFSETADRSSGDYGYINVNSLVDPEDAAISLKTYIDVYWYRD